MGRLENKIVLITGGTSGIGFACAERFAEEGAAVIMASRGEERGEEAEASLRSQGYNASFIPCDVSNRESVEALKQQVQERHGRLDILVNNAGVLRTGSLEEITDESSKPQKPDLQKRECILFPIHSKPYMMHL